MEREVKKIILVFLIMVIATYADGSVDKIKSLTQRLEKINYKFIQIKDNNSKYNHFMRKYKEIFSKYKNLINLCERNKCENETINIKKNFKQLKKSINTLNDMIETDIASFRSLEKQKKAIEGLIRMEKSKVNLTRDEVESIINAM